MYDSGTVTGGIIQDREGYPDLLHDITRTGKIVRR